MTSWLLHGLIDFDYVAESLLPELGGGETQGGSGEAEFVVGKGATAR